jgi:hypothetical protein
MLVPKSNPGFPVSRCRCNESAIVVYKMKDTLPLDSVRAVPGMIRIIKIIRDKMQQS